MCLELVVIGFGLLTIVGMIIFGLIKLNIKWPCILDLCKPELSNLCKNDPHCKTFKEINAEFQERRNEFWQGLIQCAIIISIITLLAVLMLEDKVSSEAALPIITGLGSFAVGKTVKTVKTITAPDNVPGKDTHTPDNPPVKDTHAK